MSQVRGKLAYEEVDWQRLDKKKAFIYGAGIFSGLTTALYPLSVIKTRQMTTVVAPGFKGVRDVSGSIAREEGVRGFYRGFYTIVFGAIPARVVYLTTLEWTKSFAQEHLKNTGLSQPVQTGVASFLAGGAASLATQTITVPIDVISSKQIVFGQKLAEASGSGGSAASPLPASGTLASPQALSRTNPARSSALSMVKSIIREEGVRGLYKGYSMSLLTLVPSSAVWWSAYGLYQKEIWALVYGDAHPLVHQVNEVLSVQVGAAVLAGCTSAFFSTPLDLVKTRIQVSHRQGNERVSAFGVATQVFRDDGPKGFFRGLVPRTFNTALWGTCMVSAYEFLKRVCQKPDDEILLATEVASH